MSYSKPILLAAAFLLNSSVAKPLSHSAIEFESLLMAADCASVHANKAFDLRAFGRSFPIAKGFDFFGDEYRRVVFRDMPETDPLVDATHRSDEEKAVAEFRSRGSILYSEKEEDERALEDRTRFFESMQWSGIQLLFRSDVGGHIVRTRTYQLIAYVGESDRELTISVVDPQIAANSIACAVSIER